MHIHTLPKKKKIEELRHTHTYIHTKETSTNIRCVNKFENVISKKLYSFEINI